MAALELSHAPPEQATVGIEASNENASFGREDSNYVLDPQDLRILSWSSVINFCIVLL